MEDVKAKLSKLVKVEIGQSSLGHIENTPFVVVDFFGMLLLEVALEEGLLCY